MPKFSTSTYLKALSLVALALFFTNCAPKGPSTESKLKAHCLQSMDPKNDFLATAEKLSDSAQIRIVTSDYSEKTLRDDMPIEETTLDPNIVVEKPVVELKQQVAEDLLPKKYCGSHQVKLPDGTVARISSISKSHLEATWTKMKKTSDNSKAVESVNSLTYRYVIDPDTKNEYLEITEMSLRSDRKKMVKKDVYIAEELPQEIKMKAGVLMALGGQTSADFIKLVIDDVKGNKVKVKNNKLVLSQEQVEQLKQAQKPLDINSQTTVKLSPKSVSKLKNYINEYVKSSKQKVKINENTVDNDAAEVRIGNPSVDKSTYVIENE